MQPAKIGDSKQEAADSKQRMNAVLLVAAGFISAVGVAAITAIIVLTIRPKSSVEQIADRLLQSQKQSDEKKSDIAALRDNKWFSFQPADGDIANIIRSVELCGPGGIVFVNNRLECVYGALVKVPASEIYRLSDGRNLVATQPPELGNKVLEMRTPQFVSLNRERILKSFREAVDDALISQGPSRN